MNYLENLAQLAEDAGAAEYVEDANFLGMVSLWIVSAENRILRDLDLLATTVSDPSGVLTPNLRRFLLPTSVGTFVVLETLRLVDTTVIPNVTRPALDWISKEAMDAIYPGDGAVGDPSIPRYIAPFDQQSVLLGPPPGFDFPVICDGTQRPLSLSVGATLDLSPTPPTITIASSSPAENGTFISTQLPDLFHAAQMIDVSAWERNFTAMADEPKMSLNWSLEYDRLMKPALAEEMRKRLASQGWSTRLPNPVATPPQT